MYGTDIDKAEQITLKQVEASLAERIKRGEVDYNGRSVIVKQPDITKKDPLIVCGERGYLEPWNVGTGQQIRSIREIGHGKLLQGRRASDISTGNGNGICYQTLYNKVKREMCASDWARIASICFAEKDIDGRYNFNETTFAILGHLATSYQKAFDQLEETLTKHLSAMRKQLDEANNSPV